MTPRKPSRRSDVDTKTRSSPCVGGPVCDDGKRVEGGGGNRWKGVINYRCL